MIKMINEEIRKEALAKYLGCEAEDLEENEYRDNCFSVNPRERKQGEPPSYYIEIVNQFKTLLTPEQIEQIKEYLGLNSYDQSIERDKLYYSIEKYLKQNKADNPTYSAIKAKALYVENVLYHILSDEDRDFVKSYKNAFLGLPVEDNREYMTVDDGEYLILTDEEADEEAEEYIKSSLWAFNASFIIEHSDLPWEAQEMILSYQEDRCEEANETIGALITDMEEFVEDAIGADGRAHFLNTYDDEENEITINGETLYIYRIN